MQPLIQFSEQEYGRRLLMFNGAIHGKGSLSQKYFEVMALAEKFEAMDNDLRNIEGSAIVPGKPILAAKCIEPPSTPDELLHNRSAAVLEMQMTGIAVDVASPSAHKTTSTEATSAAKTESITEDEQKRLLIDKNKQAALQKKRERAAFEDFQNNPGMQWL